MPYFSSGLAAIQNLTPPPSPTQLFRPDSPILPLTPTCEATTDITDKNPIPSQTFNTDRPKLRKRRSSLTVNTSPLVQLKGSYRGATTAAQRQNRSRSGSVNDFPQPCSIGFSIEEVQIIGRSRSGSVGNSLRSRRVIRGARPPPPSTPLPPLPPLPTVPSSAPYLGGFNLGTDISRHHPLVFKASTLGNLEQATQISPVDSLESDVGLTFDPVVDAPLVMKEN